MSFLLAICFQMDVLQRKKPRGLVPSWKLGARANCDGALALARNRERFLPVVCSLFALWDNFFEQGCAQGLCVQRAV